jgi:hypothetical protein
MRVLALMAWLAEAPTLAWEQSERDILRDR